MLVLNGESCQGQHDETLVCLWQAPRVYDTMWLSGESSGGRASVMTGTGKTCFSAYPIFCLPLKHPAMLARRFEQRPSTVTYACQRGEQMAIKQNYQLVSNKYWKIEGRPAYAPRLGPNDVNFQIFPLLEGPPLLQHILRKNLRTPI